jgi:DNA polymerase-3 subunit beta
MKFETTLESLTATSSVVTRFAEKRANLPVLGCALITAEGNRVIVRATNLECGVEIIIPAKITKEGVVAVPAAVLAGFLSNARGKSVSVELDGEVLKVHTDRAHASIKTLPNEDFPILPRVSAEQSFTIKSSDLVRAIRSVLYCASLSAIKPELQSILLYGEGGKLTTVATDSFRLAEKTVPMRAGGSVPELLIPARNAGELMRILDGVQGEVELYYNDNQLSVQTEGIYYTSRLLDGAFPNYRQILPKTFTTQAVVLREDMSGALKSLSVFADKFAQVSLTLDSDKKSMFLSSRNPDVGEQTSTVKAAIEGESVSISFNGRYLADSLQGIVGDSVRLHSNGPGKAILIKDASEDSFQYLAMPMNR